MTGPPPALLALRLLGPMALTRGGASLSLPASRKTRALLAYLALATRPVSRSRLCELLWDAPDDPRGELRWSLSKLRSVLEHDRKRVLTADDAVAVDLSDASVDAIEVGCVSPGSVGTLTPPRCLELAQLFAGEFLEGLDVEGCAAFNAWLTAERRRLRSIHMILLERLADDDTGDPNAALERWLHIAPFDLQVHARLLQRLAHAGRRQEAEAHLGAASARFESEGLDPTPLRQAWQAVRGAAAGTVHVAVEPASAAPRGDTDAAARRASVAVMPFVDVSSGAHASGRGAADALAHDVITRLAKLRSLFVIAQGTVFSLHERHIGPAEAGRMLNVDYVASGSLQVVGQRLTVTVELAEARAAHIVWSEVFNRTLDDLFLVLDEIGNRIVASIASEIEALERNRAILRPPSSLDAWEAHHRGLWHAYRFSRDDNARALHFFRKAVTLDPTYARAHAGISFAHFQDAFQGWAPRGPAIARAFESAGQSLMADDRDPAAHWAMGRALWLQGHHEESVTELEAALELSPNFALGHYTLAFVQSQAGDPEAAIASSDYSRSLSPFDPLLFGMLGSRSMALLRLGRHDEAAEWGLRAAARPNAHAHIHAIAAFSLALAGRSVEAAAQAAAIRAARPHYTVADFLASFRFDDDAAALFRAAARRISME